MKGLASTFADPADVAAFKRCKATGKSDLECFRVGDNGIGFWGDVTAQNEIPMCAIRKSWLLSIWGELNGGYRKKVTVYRTVNGVTYKVDCMIADVMGEKVKASIALTPAAQKALRIVPPALVPVEFFLA